MFLIEAPFLGENAESIGAGLQMNRSGAQAVPPGTDADQRDRMLEAFLAGDPDAVGRATRIVCQVVRFKGFFIPREQRADVVQEAMLDLWRAAVEDDRDRPRNFRAFVRMLAYRRCVDWVRTRREDGLGDVEVPSGAADPESRLLREDELELGRKLIGRLRDSCRELFRLYATGRGYRQIAEMSGRSEKAIRNQMSDCLGTAREILGRLRMRERRRFR